VGEKLKGGFLNGGQGGLGKMAGKGGGHPGTRRERKISVGKTGDKQQTFRGWVGFKRVEKRTGM